MEDNKYLGMFLDESKEHLEQVSQCLLILEKDPDDQETVNRLFRSIHTLKGMAGSMQYSKMMTLSHTMENTLDNVRDGSLDLTSHIVDTLFRGLDYLQQMLDNIEQTGSEGSVGIDDVLDPLKKLSVQKKLQNNDRTVEKDNQPFLDGFVTNVLVRASNEGFNIFRLDVKLSDHCVLKGARAYMVFRTLEQYSQIVYSNPSAEDIENGSFSLAFSLIVITKENKYNIYNDIMSISEIEQVDIESIKASDLPGQGSSQATGRQEKDSTPKQMDKQKNSGLSMKNTMTRTIRVDIQRLDKLMNMVSELIIIKNRLEQLSTKDDSDFRESIEYLERVTSDIHGVVMKVRMVPIELVFNRFPRLVRDLARETGKKINLYITGGDTEIDRTVVDEIADPIIHLIRNSADHGIETEKERIAAGKKAEGSIYLTSYYDGNNVVIELKDDGRGIDIAEIKQKILDNGLIGTEDLDAMDEERVIEYLFQPGFTTTEKVSNISGRGVGLDVVKTKVESLGGVVEVQSQPNIGTRFIIRLPLNLSIMEAMLVGVEQKQYAIPLSSIVEILELSNQEVRTVLGGQTINYRGNFIPLLYLNELLNINTRDQKNSDRLILVILRKGEKLKAVAVDRLLGQREIVIKSLGKYLSNIKSILGATILGDGRVALILDINHLI